MQPIVHGLEVQYQKCLEVIRVNAATDSDWRRVLRPFGTPEFFLLDGAGAVVSRWFGVTDREEFEALLLPRCTAG